MNSNEALKGGNKPRHICYIVVCSNCEESSKLGGYGFKSPDNSKAATANFCQDCISKTDPAITALGPVLEFFDDQGMSIKRYDKFADYILEFGTNFIVDSL